MENNFIAAKVEHCRHPGTCFALHINDLSALSSILPHRRVRQNRALPHDLLPRVRCHVMTRAPSATSFTPFTSPLPGQGWVLCRVKTNPDSAGYCLPKLSKSQTRREGLFRWSSLCITTFLNRSNSRAPRPQHLHLTIGLQVYHIRYQCVCVHWILFTWPPTPDLIPRLELVSLFHLHLPC